MTPIAGLSGFGGGASGLTVTGGADPYAPTKDVMPIFHTNEDGSAFANYNEFWTDPLASSLVLALPMTARYTHDDQITKETTTFYADRPVGFVFNGAENSNNVLEANGTQKWLRWTPDQAITFTTSIKVWHSNATGGQVWTLKRVGHSAESAVTISTGGQWQTLYSGSGTIEYLNNVAPANNWNSWGGLELDGVQVVDFEDVHHLIKGSGSSHTSTLYSDDHSVHGTDTTQKYYGNGSVYFDGNGCITFNNNADFALGTGNFTFEFWIYPTDNTNNRCLFDLRDETGSGASAQQGFSIVVQGNHSIHMYCGGYAISSGADVVTEDAWHHVAIVRSGSTTTKMYVNGTYIGNSGANFDFSDQNFTMGADVNSAEGWKGYFQDIRLYKGAAKYTSNFNTSIL